MIVPPCVTFDTLLHAAEPTPSGFLAARPRYRRPMDQPAGLEPGQRYRCGACGNLTRFDITSTERVRRFWHVELSGAAQVDEADLLAVAVESVTCRWCAAGGTVEVVPAPGS